MLLKIITVNSRSGFEEVHSYSDNWETALKVGKKILRDHGAVRTEVLDHQTHKIIDGKDAKGDDIEKGVIISAF